jgi:hypothetical protein
LVSNGLLYIAVAVIVILFVLGIVLVFFRTKRITSPQNAKSQSPPPLLGNEKTLPAIVSGSQSDGLKYPSNQQGTIFISHIENDAIVALEIAKGLENAGFKTWYYERDSLPGVSYLVQTCTAIEESQAVVVIISQASMKSKQMTVEIVRTHEAGKPFIPVLRGINHNNFKTQQPEWAEALGAAASVLIPEDGTLSVLPKIVGGLKRLGVINLNNSSQDYPRKA